VRLVFGLLCAWYVFDLIQVAGYFVGADGHIRPLILNGVLPGLFLVSYVINIGFSRAWKKWPAIVSGGIFAAIAGFGYFANGSGESALLARVVWCWELYLFSHLGAAFIVSGLIGTPGCEMRAFHDLFSRISGIPTKEHHCPVGPLQSIDQWETSRSQR